MTHTPSPPLPPGTPRPAAPRRVQAVWSSGTGNSRRAALWCAEALRIRGLPTTVRGLQDRPPELAEGDLLLLAYPTHGFTAPLSVLRYAARMPKGRGRGAALLVTRGGGWYFGVPLPGCAASAGWLVALILRLKGYRVESLTGLDLPANWNALHPGMNSRHSAWFFRRARVKVRRFAAGLAAGRGRLLGPGNLIELALGLVLLPLSLVYLTAGRLFLSQLFFADERCDGCNLCVRSCPESAIRPGGRHPRWTLRCESCHRCMSICPRQAVQAHHAVVPLLVLAGGLLALPLAPHLPGPLREVAGWAGTVGLLFLLQHLVSRLGGLPLGILGHSTLTRWYRRYREPDTGRSDLGVPKDPKG